MKERIRILIIMALLAWLPAHGGGADSCANVLRPVLSAYTLHAGSAHVAETYLSSLRYSGQAFGFGYERMQAMKFCPDRWVMDLRLGLEGTHTLNPARNAALWGADIEAGWAMMRRFRPAPAWSLFVGGSTDIDAGLSYSERNSNNPVAARASWTVSVMAAAAWNGTVGRLPVCLRLQSRMPITGVFFAPEYGELYYEIYLGNHHGLVRGAWPGNYFRLDNMLSADLRFGGTILRLGYRLDVHSSKASHIVTRRISHCAVVGLASEWVSLSARRSNIMEARIISALY